jgi:hypothetical protein
MGSCFLYYLQEQWVAAAAAQIILPVADSQI